MRIFNIAPQNEQAFFCDLMAITTAFIPVSESMVTLFFKKHLFTNQGIQQLIYNLHFSGSKENFSFFKPLLKIPLSFNRLKAPSFLCIFVAFVLIYVTLAVWHPRCEPECLCPLSLTRVCLMHSPRRGLVRVPLQELSECLLH